MDEQEQYDNSGYGYPAMRSDKADMLDKIRPDEIVEVVRHKLMGEDFTASGWVKNPAVENIAITPTGAWVVANFLLPVSNKNVALSNLKDHEIKKRTIAICDGIMEACLKNWKEFGIKGIDQMRFIYEIVFSITYTTLKQPMDDGMKRFIGRTVSELRMSSNMEQKGQSFMSQMFKARRESNQ